MPKKRLSQEVLDFIEQTGMVLEREGLPRMAGRVLGYLLVADPPRQSIADLMEALQASNGSISTMTRLLEQQGYIDRVGVPGDRRDHFTVRAGGWSRMLVNAQAGVAALRGLMERALDLVPSRSHPSRAAIEEGRDFFMFLEETLPEAVARWEEKRKERDKERRRS